MLQSAEVQNKLETLKNNSLTKNEKGFKVKADGTTSAVIEGVDHEVEMGDFAGYQGGYHNHTPTGIPMLSPPDIDNGLLKAARSQGNQGNAVNNSFFGMVKKEVCSSCPGGYKIYHYVIRFTGTYNDALVSFSQEKINKLKDDYEMRYSFYESLGQAGLEKLFFQTIKEMNLENKVILQRVDETGTFPNITYAVQNITLDANNQPQNTPCL